MSRTTKETSNKTSTLGETAPLTSPNNSVIEKNESNIKKQTDASKSAKSPENHCDNSAGIQLAVTRDNEKVAKTVDIAPWDNKIAGHKGNGDTDKVVANNKEMNDRIKGGGGDKTSSSPSENYVKEPSSDVTFIMSSAPNLTSYNLIGHQPAVVTAPSNLVELQKNAFAPTVGHVSASVFEPSTLPPKQDIVPPVMENNEDTRKWFYKDPQGQVQGIFCIINTFLR